MLSTGRYYYIQSQQTNKDYATPVAKEEVAETQVLEAIEENSRNCNVMNKQLQQVFIKLTT